VTVTLDAAQVEWSRLAERWGELTSEDSRADPVLTHAASEVRAAILATACTPTGWATPDAIGHCSPLGAVWLLFEPVEEQPRAGEDRRRNEGRGKASVPSQTIRLAGPSDGVVMPHGECCSGSAA
jgi:hypothetical protein